MLCFLFARPLDYALFLLLAAVLIIQTIIKLSNHGHLRMMQQESCNYNHSRPNQSKFCGPS